MKSTKHRNADRTIYRAIFVTLAICIVPLGLIGCGAKDEPAPPAEPTGETAQPDDPAETPSEAPEVTEPTKPAETEAPASEEPAHGEEPPADTEPEPEATAPTPPEEPAPTEVEATAPTPPSAAAPASGVAGMVKLDGVAPRRRAIQMSADPNCVAHYGTKKVGTEDVLVGKNQQIVNVFVYVENGAALGSFATPTQPAKLDQIGCMYRPRISGIRVGQPLEIVNSDGFAHNVHSFAEINRPFNNAQPTAGTLTKNLRRAENAIRFKCDIHPWMQGYVFVMDHPLFSVTDKTGTFSIPGLPPGTHTIIAWHEKFGERKATVTVPAAGGAVVDFTFTP